MKSMQYLVACGDSFLYGSDLKSPNHTWTAVLAEKMNLEYICLARPGVGNAQILQQILQAQAQFGHDAVYVINWTWIDRFDYVDITHDTWHTTRPVFDDPKRDSFYYRYFHSELADKFYNLVYVDTAQNTLLQHQYLMTYMDYLLLDQRWHSPDYVQCLQTRVRSNLQNFHSMNFLDWSRQQGHAVSPQWHPLEAAHNAASEFWTPVVRELIITNNSNK
jgi:hypothetical protein